LLSLYRGITTDLPQAICRTAIDASGNKIGRLTLAGRQLGFRPAWALGSAGAIRSFPVLAGIESLSIIVDNDEADRNGRRAGQSASLECARRWLDAGKEVHRLVPKKPGTDFNDCLGEVRHG
jgi:Toprim domain